MKLFADDTFLMASDMDISIAKEQMNTLLTEYIEG